MPTPTPGRIYTPTGLKLSLGVEYTAVMTAFSDTTGSHGDLLSSGACAVGRRNFITSSSTRSHTTDTGTPIYKYSYIPYGSQLKLTLYNSDGSIKRAIYVTVLDDCLKRNIEKLAEVRYYNESAHPEIDWDSLDLWVDLWVPLEEKDLTSIRQITVTIMSFGSWDAADID